MKKLTIFTISLLLSGTLLSGCNLFNNGPKELDDTGVKDSMIEDVVKANNEFTIKMYKELSKSIDDSDENIFFSPYSLSTAMSMAYEGTDGETEEEIRSVFEFPKATEGRQLGNAGLYNKLNTGDEEYLLRTANAIWMDKDYDFKDDYIETIEKYYGGESDRFDFGKEPEKARKDINKWVAKQTEDKIEDLIPEGTLSRKTRLVLTNAVYFKGNWENEFNKDHTYETEFRVSPNKRLQVDMMSSDTDDSMFNYGETEDLQIVELPYKGEDISMYVILPSETLEGFEEDLSIEKLNELIEGMKEEEVMVEIPKFKLLEKYMVEGNLINMGVEKLFSEKPDLSKMTDNKDIFFSHVIHNAFIEVDEEGTEAAAATATTADIAALPDDDKDIKIFKADHPFMFIIKEKDTESILFIGRVSFPTTKVVPIETEEETPFQE